MDKNPQSKPTLDLARVKPRDQFTISEICAVPMGPMAVVELAVGEVITIQELNESSVVIQISGGNRLFIPNQYAHYIKASVES